MTTIIPEPSQVKNEPGQLVEMAWDPITRIVGSLGIYTKIDFENREVVECHSTSSIFRGYSIFMKGKDPRDAHFITSRICGICGDNHATCSCYYAEHGLRRQAAEPRRVDREPRRGRGIHVRPQHLSGEPGRRRLLREDGRRDQPERAGEGREHVGTALRCARLPDHRRHHALAEPLHRGVLPGGAAGQPVDPGDVLPDGGPARPSVHAVSRWCRNRRHHPADDRLHDPADALRRVHEEGRADARRPVRLLLRGAARLREGRSAPHPARLLGLVPGPRCAATSRTRTWRSGATRCSSPRAWWSTASWSPTHWWTSTSVSGSFWAVRITTTGPIRRCSSRPIRSAIRWTVGIRGTSTPTPGRRSAIWTTSTAG